MEGRKRPVIGIMSGAFNRDTLKTFLSTIEETLSGEEVDIHFYFGTVSSSLVEQYSLDDVGFGCHYYSLFSYSNYDAPDILVIIYGNIIGGQNTVMDIHRFMAHLPRVPVILLKDDSDLPENPGSISINIDNYEGMKECIRHLVCEHGYKTGFITGQMIHNDSIVRLNAYRDVLKENGIEYDEGLVRYGSFQGDVEDEAEDLISKNPDLNAIACSNDEIALTVYNVAKKLNKTIGKDLFVTGFDDLSISRYLDPPLTTVYQDYGRVARICANKIRSILHGESVKSELINADLIYRGSCGCRIEEKTSEKGMNEDGKSLLVESRSSIRNMQIKSLISTLILRNLQMRSATEKKFFEKLANLLNHIGTRNSFLCLLDKPKVLEEGEMLMAPPYLKLYMVQQRDSYRSYDKTDAPRISYGGLSELLSEKEKESVNLMNFILFHGKTQYGLLSVEIGLEDVLLYETLSLEIGSALFFLYIALEQQELSRALEEKNQILDYSANHDELTGILNRTGIMSKIVDYIHENRENDDTVFAMIMADLDHLKQINDKFGHAEGDYAICAATDILKNALPEGSPLGRSGGDEFTGIMKIDSLSDREAFGARVRILCEDKNAESGKPYYVNVSFGCQEFRAGDFPGELKNIMKQADEKLYEAKKTRRENVVRELPSSAS